MKKTASVIMTAAIAGMAMAADSSGSSRATGEKSPEVRKTIFEQRSGGMVRREAEGPKIVVVDGRAKPGKVLKYFEVENVGGHGTTPGLPVKTYAEAIDGSEAMTKAIGILGRESAAMSIVISCGGGDMPSLTVCPEDRVAVINADKYDGKDILLLKEVWRAIGFIGGVGYSKYSADPMQPVFSKADIEAVQGSALLPTSLNALRTFNARFDIKPAYSVPYIAAVRQGWAPAPTNDVQKAIWDKIHEMPTEPIKIKPETRKVQQ